MFLRQEWNDRRLAHHDNGMLPVQGKDVQKIWRPDTYFTNMNDYKLYEDNQLALISRFGYVYYSSRWTETTCHGGHERTDPFSNMATENENH